MKKSAQLELLFRTPAILRQHRVRRSIWVKQQFWQAPMAAVSWSTDTRVYTLIKKLRRSSGY